MHNASNPDMANTDVLGTKNPMFDHAKHMLHMGVPNHIVATQTGLRIETVDLLDQCD